MDIPACVCVPTCVPTCTPTCTPTCIPTCIPTFIPAHPQVTLDGCHDCRLLVGPVDGALMMRQCTSLQISAVCRQLRCRDCADCTLRLFTQGPIIESSVRMSFGPWNAAYPRLASHLAKVGLTPTDAQPNQWAAVHDFNEPHVPAGAAPSNWRCLPEAAFADSWQVTPPAPLSLPQL